MRFDTIEINLVYTLNQLTYKVRMKINCHHRRKWPFLIYTFRKTKITLNQSQWKKWPLSECPLSAIAKFIK